MRFSTVHWAYFVIAFAMVLSACGEDSCAPGETQLCSCAAEEVGVQICADDGEGWGACDCTGADGGADTDADTDADGGLDCPEPVCDGPCVRYVSTTGSGCGLSWDDAFSRMQDGVDAAFAAATECGTTCQVWVAAGTYVIPEGGETDTLQLRPGVGVYGGFSGSETALEQRDWIVNETVLDGTGMTGTDPHLVTGSDDSLLDGFTIANTFGWTGGAAYAEDSALDIANCSFHDNPATMGGIVDAIRSSVTIRDCVFFLNYQNGTWEDGADVRIWDSSASISDCVFRGDPAGEQDSFAIDVWGDVEGGNATMTNCVFSNLSNGAIRVGGSEDAPSLATVAGSVFFGAVDGPAIDGFGDLFSYLVVTNSVFWGNGEDINGPFEASYSDFEIEVAGDGNISADPLFVDPENGDFHLQAGSPCIDAADGDAATALDLEGYSRVDDPATTNTGVGAITYADIGAYEFQP